MGRSRLREGEGHIKKSKVQTKSGSTTKEIEAGAERDTDKN